MVFIKIMTRGAAGFFRFFRKNHTGAGTHQNASNSPIFVTQRKWASGCLSRCRKRNDCY